MIELDDLILYALGETDQTTAAKIESDPQLVQRAKQIAAALKSVGRINLKLILMELGNVLVTDYKFNPASYRESPSTSPIDDFTRWLNETPEAREVLESMGVDWPVSGEGQSVRF